jgi:hypothetical protein
MAGTLNVREKDKARAFDCEHGLSVIPIQQFLRQLFL